MTPKARSQWKTRRMSDAAIYPTKDYAWAIDNDFVVIQPAPGDRHKGQQRRERALPVRNSRPWLII